MSAPYRTIAADLERQGWSVVPRFIGARLRQGLAEEIRQRLARDEFRLAGVGRGPSRRQRPQVRSDWIAWLDPATPSDWQRLYLDRMERLRQSINRNLWLGLFDFEAHLALYPPGACYARHVDRFADVDYRRVSCVLYLNEHWVADDGGALRLYLNEDDSHVTVDIPPEGGTLVSFLSDRYYHEVLPARRERLSIAGWFSVRRPPI